MVAKTTATKAPIAETALMTAMRLVRLPPVNRLISRRCERLRSRLVLRSARARFLSLCCSARRLPPAGLAALWLGALAGFVAAGLERTGLGFAPKDNLGKPGSARGFPPFGADLGWAAVAGLGWVSEAGLVGLGLSLGRVGRTPLLAVLGAELGRRKLHLGLERV